MRCRAKKNNGERCGANALVGGKYCWFHDPERKESRAVAQKAGGVERTRKIADQVLSVHEADLELDNTNAVIRLLAQTINQARTGRIGLRVATTVGYLSQILLKALDQGELEKRLEEIEKYIDSNKNRQSWR